MGIMDIFRINKIKGELEALKVENQTLKSLLRPEHNTIFELNKEIEHLNNTKRTKENEIDDITRMLTNIKRDLEEQIAEQRVEYEKKKNEIIILDEQLMLESFALYQPKYEMQNSEMYKQKLDDIRDQQKTMIKNGTAATGSTSWRVNNSLAEGRKMVNDMIKLLLRSFNNECDASISGVKFNNIESCEKRIRTSHITVNKLGRIMDVTINPKYVELKIKELHLAYEYQLKKQEEKEEQKRIREQMREEAKLQKEIEEVRKLAEKEKKHYTNALEKAKKQLDDVKTEEERAALLEKIDAFNNQLAEIDKQIKEVDYREANQRAGYVYVISNVGSFGDNIYKIGMTRRLDPYERVSELSDASVPFSFDVHAMVFSDDAPKLEATLHKAFEDKKVNAVNARREFFNVTLDEIAKVITQNHDKTVEIIRMPEAKEYRESQIIKRKMNVVSFYDSAIMEAAATSDIQE